MLRASKTGSPRRQRGVAAIFAAVSLVTLVSALALAVDVGRLYYANRDLQRLSDLAAIDGARVQSQCLGAAGITEVTAEVDASLKRNKLPQGVTVVTRLGRRQDGADGLQFFLASATGEPADSVQVSLSRPSPARILPLFAGEQSRRLSTRAAAQSEWVASARIGPPRDGSASGSYSNAFLDSVFGGRPGTGASGSFSGASAQAMLSVTDVVNAGGEVNATLPDLQQPTETLGLLSQIEALLNQTGDAAAAAAVSTYAQAVAAARPGSTVIPAEVLGLPAQGAYDGATTSVGDVLNAIAGAVSEGDAIQLPNLCALIDLDGLPTAAILPPLCDTQMNLTIAQPSQPGVFNSSTPVSSTSVSTGGSNAAASTGGLASTQVGLTNPVTGQPLGLPLLAAATPARAAVTSLACARLGQALNVAQVSARGATATFAVGDSATFAQRFGQPGGEPEGALDDLAPVPLIRTTVQQLLGSAGLGGVAALASPLNATFLSQPVTISVRAGPVVIGDARGEEFCMQGPPFGTGEQCNGAAASVGAVNATEAAARLAEALGDVVVTVETPPGLPLGLSQALRPVTDALAETLAESIRPAISTVAGQLVPVLESANLVVGESRVYLDSAQAGQPRVYAQ